MSKTGLSKPILYFAQVREDPLIELGYFADITNGKIFAIASGGCTVLSLLLLRPAQVLAVDVNPAQEALVGLKVAAFKELNHNELLSFLGIHPSKDRWATYQKIRRSLTVEHRAFWDQRPSWIHAGVHYAGRTERFYRFLSKALLLVHPERRVRQFFTCRDLESQRQFYEQTWCNLRWRVLFRLLLSRPVQVRVFSHSPFAQTDEQSFAEYFYQVADRAFRQIPIWENYFLSQIMLGEYLEGPLGAPPYLLKENRDAIRDQLHVLKTICAPAHEVLAGEPDRSLDAFAISNLFDWQSQEERERTCRDVLRTGKRGAKIVYRNLVSSPPLPAWFEQAIEWDEQCSREYHQKDRAFMYKRLRVGRIST
jgi:S-adenosylmethionine-diacylglycerol 3-amino-3-carboxypropyl transferase